MSANEDASATALPEIYRSSSLFFWLLLLVSAGVAAAAIFVAATRNETAAMLVGVLGGGFFGLGALVFAAILLNPQTLRLDEEGFEVAGGLQRKPYKTLWRDVARFRLWRTGRLGSPTFVAYDYVPGYEPPAEPSRAAKLLKFNRKMGLPDAALPAGWAIPAAALCERLDDRRRRVIEH